MALAFAIQESELSSRVSTQTISGYRKSSSNNARYSRRSAAKAMSTFIGSRVGLARRIKSEKSFQIGEEFS